MTTRQPIPLRPEPAALQRAAISVLSRACIAHGLAALDKPTRPAEHARRRWGSDAAQEIDLLTRAAVAPGTLTNAPVLATVAPAFLPRVFCASLADVFGNEVPGEWRIDLTVTSRS